MIMDQTYDTYHCAVIGGGVAGLCLSIQLAEAGFAVVLFEKNTYPFHKLCGEYISMESWDFLVRLGLPLPDLALPVINELGISSESGFMLEHQLRKGGFGISRYTLDHQLSMIARRKGVVLIENCRVTGVKEGAKCTVETTQGQVTVDVVCGSYGKYTPAFIHERSGYGKQAGGEAGQFIGVKYHVRCDLPANRIELHNFTGGYCGISKVDQDWYCLCYLTTVKNLLEHGKDIRQMEKNVLHKNPYLKNYFLTSEFVRTEPLVISNIGFSKKQTSVNGILLLGDAAGSITPLCGNGMSIGIRASKLLAGELVGYFHREKTKEQALADYRLAWNKAFEMRIKTGYYLQHLFGKRSTTDAALKFLNHFPPLMSRLVSLTHGTDI
jgi:flavin-dependent dehydrogenase